MYKLLHGDVEEKLDYLINTGVKVDCVITSPPYNIGKLYPGVDDNRAVDKYLYWCTRWMKQVAELMKPSASFFLNLGGKVSDSMLPIRLARLTYKFFTLQNTIIWVKSLNIPEVGSFGHFKPVNSDAYLSGMFEYIFHLVPCGAKVSLRKNRVAVPYADKSNVERYGRGADKRDIGNVWFMPYPTKNKSEYHPTLFPLDLPLKCLKLALPSRRAVVLDPFVGGGTTGQACAKLGVVDFIGIDTVKSYIQMSTTRIASALTEYKRDTSVSASYL